MPKHTLSSRDMNRRQSKIFAQHLFRPSGYHHHNCILLGRREYQRNQSQELKTCKTMFFFSKKTVSSMEFIKILKDQSFNNTVKYFDHTKPLKTKVTSLHQGPRQPPPPHTHPENFKNTLNQLWVAIIIFSVAIRK